MSDAGLAQAEPSEAQIVDWLRGFRPDAQSPAVVLATLRRGRRGRTAAPPGGATSTANWGNCGISS